MFPSTSFYTNEDPSRTPMPGDMLKYAQDQHSNNQDALIVRLRELLCPVLSDTTSRNDLIIISVENPLILDADISDMLSLDVAELMQVWEARPISLFSCLYPACRASIEVRNRAHLLRLIRLDKYFGFRIGAGDLVESKVLSEMLCESCAQELQHCQDEENRAVQLAMQARYSELRKMPFREYRLTPEWRSRRNRVLLRAGNKCELCFAAERLDAHHKTYERYGAELLSDLTALCRTCHQRHHGLMPEAA